MTDPVRIGNCSGFYGDRISAMREMLEGGDLDYLTGDYLAELTMLILGRDRMKDPTRGYAKTFLRQARGLPRARAGPRREDRRQRRRTQPGRTRRRAARVNDRLGLNAPIAHVEGDDLHRAGRRTRARRAAADRQRVPRRWGIVECLDAGARRRGHRARHRRVRRGRRPRVTFGWAARRFRPARGCGRGRSRDRVRHAGHRWQLLVLHRDRRPGHVPASRSRRSTPTVRRSSPSTPVPAER